MLAIVVISAIISYDHVDGARQSKSGRSGKSTAHHRLQKQGRLRVMLKSGAQHHFRENQCSAGLWVENAFKRDPIRCICVRGT